MNCYLRKDKSSDTTRDKKKLDSVFHYFPDMSDKGTTASEHLHGLRVISISSLLLQILRSYNFYIFSLPQIWPQT